MKLTSAALAVLLAGVSTAAMAQTVTGAGSSFAGPLYTAWAKAAASDTGVTLNYQANGSGAGMNAIKARTVDFGGTDAPLTDEKLAAAKEFQFPTAIGAIVPVVNLPGIASNQLKLSGEVLAAIYAGEISNWNDPKIAALNPGVSLPDLAIAPVHRADASGTTFVFTSYLSTVSPDFKTKVGAATSVNWPGGTGAKGNPGVAGSVANVAGAIGYVEYVYAAKTPSLITVEMENGAGVYLKPTPASFAAAAASADWTHAKGFVASMLNTKGVDSWPIVTATYAVIPTDSKNAANTTAVLKLVDWGYSKGGDIATNLFYITLPTSVEASIRTAWKSLKAADGTTLWK